jgi:hypothetical protein
MAWTTNQIVTLLNTTITSPIQIHVVDGKSPVTATVEGVEQPTMAVYIPKLKLIEFYVGELDTALAFLAKVGEKVCPGKKLNTERAILSYVVHELRHYDQHMWLVERYGERDAELIFCSMNTCTADWADRVIEQDALKAQFGQFQDLDLVMELAIRQIAA